MSTVPAPPQDTRPRLLDRMLKPFADVKAGEGPTALLLMLNVYLLLTAYYAIKPVREALILSRFSPEMKSYTSAAMVVLLLFFVPAYGAFASRVSRIRLITWVTLFFISNLVIFYLMASAEVPNIGIAFFVWMGIFNVTIIAQFWAFANDVYTPERGKRLFAIVAFGSTVGAISGSALAGALIDPLGVKSLMLIAAGILAICIGLSQVVHAREGVALPAGAERASAAERTKAANAPLAPTDGFKLVLSERYLLAIGLLTLVLNFVNTNGEYILGRTLRTAADAAVAAGAAGTMPATEFREQFIGKFYAGFQGTANILAWLVQLFVVSRFLKWFGVRAALFVLPALALGGYSLLAMAPLLGTIRWVKIVENATDYSLQNTARQALFLPTSREAKYKAKQAIDTFFWRAGDLGSAALVLVGSALALTPRHFAIVNVALVVAWLGIVIVVAREHRRRTGEVERLERLAAEGAPA